MWEVWNYGYGSGWFSYCPAAFLTPLSMWDQAVQPYIMPLRADAAAVSQSALTWGVPAIVVLVALVRRKVAGRGAAAVLTLFAVLEPLTFRYFDTSACEEVRVFSGRWFVEVADRLGTTTPLLLLVAAVLVLVATQALGSADEVPVGAVTVVRRVAAFLVCYWIVILSIIEFRPMISDTGLLVWVISAIHGAP